MSRVRRRFTVRGPFGRWIHRVGCGAVAFLVRAPDAQNTIPTFVENINAFLAQKLKKGDAPPPKWELKTEAQMFRRFYGYDPASYPFLKIEFESPAAVRPARDALTKKGYELGEADMDFAAQACAGMGVAPGSWVELVDAYLLDAPPFDICADRVYEAAGMKPRPDATGMAPLRVMSIDIETLTKNLGNGAVKFYSGSDKDARLVCVAACDFSVSDPSKVTRYVFGLASTTETQEADGIILKWYKNERELFTALGDHVRARDPDFITGWNTDGFDFEWLAARAQALNVNAFWRGFSRVKGENGRYGGHGKVKLSTPGRVPYDLMQWLKKNRQLEQYKLDFVSKLYCGEKDDVEYSEIGTLFETPEGRLKLAKYCEQDAALVLRLIAVKELDPLGKDLALCAITGNFPADLLARGTQHTLRCKMLRVAQARGFVLPFVAREPGQKEEAADQEEGEETGYRGGMVLTAHAGRYVDPVAVFDFASLYPSCMEERNTCASTRLTRETADLLGIKVTTPPAPSLTGRWVLPDGTFENIEDDWKAEVLHIYSP